MIYGEDIKKELKNTTFIYSPYLKNLNIFMGKESDMSLVVLSRGQMFSLARFILRIAQKGTPKRKKKGEADGQSKLFTRTKGGISGKRR